MNNAEFKKELLGDSLWYKDDEVHSLKWLFAKHDLSKLYDERIKPIDMYRWYTGEVLNAIADKFQLDVEKNEMKQLSATCIILFDKDYNILSVTRRNTNEWCLPGGKVDPGETPEQAVVRELKEETGIVIPSNATLVKLYAELVFGDDGKDYYCECFTINKFIEIDPYASQEWSVEKGIRVKFISTEKLLQGSFSDYNKKALDIHRIWRKK